MGIPAYYSYLIKNYKKIIIKRKSLKNIVHNFYLDSNSIIYNALENIEGEFNEEFVNKLIKNICLQIDNYIKEINPTNLVYISFDGVAPFAKLKQQKERRFKSKIVTELLNDIISEKCPSIPINYNINNRKFDRTCITPGTYFMEQLDEKVREFFYGREKIYNIKNIIVSTSNERGEGEHKIFDYIRNHNNNKETHVIYGLDADLIILCLNHMHISKNIFLFRETPEFIKSLISDIDPGELYLMKIEELMYYILDKMFDNVKRPTKEIKDYVFIMFLLGNDFMPHFPSLNIRTHGIEMLLETYKNILGKKRMFIIDDNDEIVWKHFRELIEELSSMEMNNLKREYGIRNKQEKKNYDCSIEVNNISEADESIVKKKLENVLLNLPIKEREIEKMIDPYKPYWERRYYEYLFNTERTDENLKKICLNYIEGLEWNMLYYTSGCKNWRWKYNYSYPPLFKDLLNFLPLWGIEYIKEDLSNINKHVQLAYVLPLSSMYLLPEKYKDKMIEYKEKTNDVDLQWSFCRYFWESHIEFKLEKIEDIIEIFDDKDNGENINFIIKDKNIVF